MARKICVVTSSRAEYGLLKPLMDKIKQSVEFDFQLIVSGMHLSIEFGHTYKQIEQDGFTIDEKVETLMSSDSAIGVLNSLALTTMGLANAFQRLRPDLVVILGDRYEMLGVAQSALIMQIPIAHIHGGECTFGSYDDSIRHSITKMATWHFTSSEAHRNRVIQLGESPSRVWNVGALGIEHTVNLQLLSKSKVYDLLKLNEEKEVLVVTYHPETNGDSEGIYELIDALTKFNNYNIIFTKSNADNGGRHINTVIEKSLTQFENAQLVDSLGQLRYLSLVQHSTAVIGNSSSGLIEAPYLQTPTVNIGNRQKGRERPASIIDCTSDLNSIETAIHQAIQFDGNYERIFGEGKADALIMDYLLSIPHYSIKKEFYDL
ncbi:UDP-N-acetylglucosamine 2-epimerase [Paenisporosarcina cavernae]|uniref:UDP-N-acetylglucosamine 2-epimerase (Hydrolyzing) n=1 Tax=Paenisporosarcina cavernae TaxID=2320858 RepID=A0A385YR35_9BACL|nr:UDP-N-acetylglucosamine 2-epimerase [Paenisporosarcina cavernae]AYC28954.1 UDP-N-acetylglucosamine 2-epimerase (hydrolyzing) [Paenisporosarcina cavernae]